MGGRAEHIGDVIRTLRQERGLTAASLARSARVSLALVTGLEQRGPELEQVTPIEWGVLDRLAVTLGLRNGASLYKLIPDPASDNDPSASPARCGAPRIRPNAHPTPTRPAPESALPRERR